MLRHLLHEVCNILVKSGADWQRSDGTLRTFNASEWRSRASMARQLVTCLIYVPLAGEARYFLEKRWPQLGFFPNLRLLHRLPPPRLLFTVSDLVHPAGASALVSKPARNIVRFRECCCVRAPAGPDVRAMRAIDPMSPTDARFHKSFVLGSTHTHHTHTFELSIHVEQDTDKPRKQLGARRAERHRVAREVRVARDDI